MSKEINQEVLFKEFESGEIKAIIKVIIILIDKVRELEERIESLEGKK